MEDRNYMYIPYDQRITLMKEINPVRHAWTLPAGTYREREKDVLTIQHTLSQDHLTAIYWG